MHADISAPRAVLWRLALGATVTNGSPESRGVWGGFYGRGAKLSLVGWGGASRSQWESTMETAYRLQTKAWSRDHTLYHWLVATDGFHPGR